MRRLDLRLLLAAVVAVASIVFAIGCGSDDDSTSGGSTGDTADYNLIKDGTLTIGSDIPFPPFEDGKAPDPTGFDIDLVNAIADKLGLETTYVDTAFDTIFTDLAQGKFDMVASATTITPEREKVVAFSDPYYEAQQAILVTPGSDITSADDFAGKTIAAQDGTTGEMYVNDKTDADTVNGFPEAAAAVNATLGGQADATVIDQPVAQDAVEKNGGKLEIAAEIPTGELYGLPIPLDNTALLDAVNGALQDLKDDGTLTDLYQQYFKTDPPKSVLGGASESN